MRKTLFALSLLPFFTWNVALADTTFSGAIEGDVTWTKEESPYLVNYLSIPAGSSLTFLPGTIVRLSSGGSIIVGGTLTSGDQGETVTITSMNDDESGSSTPHPGDWQGITFNPGSIGTITNTSIAYGGATVFSTYYGYSFYYPLIENNGGIVSITNSSLLHSGNNAIFQSSGNITISDSNIDTAEYGIMAIDGFFTFGRNTFTNIRYYDVYAARFSNFTNLGGNTGNKGIYIGNEMHGTYTWGKDNIPYIVNGNYLYPEASLTIDPGVIIKIPLLGTGLSVDGTLIMGSPTSTEKVIITSIADDTVGGDTNGDGDASVPQAGDWHTMTFSIGTAHIANTIIRYGGAILPLFGETIYSPLIKNIRSTVTFERVELTASEYSVIDQSGGNFAITDSEISNALLGIVVSGGALSIHNSSIHDHVYYGVYNQTANTIDATHNWWGSDTGPSHPSNPGGTGDRVSDYVDYAPWLTEEPGGECLSECFAVLFIPGLAGSKLYRDSDNVWFPDRDQDARELFMNEFGASINTDVTVKDGEVAENAYLLEDVYAGLPEVLDMLKNTHVIADWKSTPYDWRLDYDVLLAGGKQTDDRVNYALGTSTPYILQTLQQLVDKAKAHKVIIITHSNGGLLAKALVKKLEEDNDPLREGIKQVVMVAPPQLGAPKAIVSMLHGDENPLSTKRWDIVENDTFRNLVEYMPTMYNLLPSEQFENSATGPFILFDDPADDPYDRAGKKAVSKYGYYDTDPILNMYRTRYPDGITTTDKLYTFLIGENGLRDKPTDDDLDTPNVLKETLLANAQNMHIALDQYVFPPSIMVTQVVGWGLPTITGIEYHRNTDDPTCLEHFPCKVSYRMGRGPITTTDGDKTVPSVSATAMPGAQTIWVNLKKYNDNIESTGDSAKSRDHSSIMGSQPIKQLLQSFLVGATTDTVPYTSTTKPSGAKYITIEKHSPVDLDLYDSEGNHTGFVDVLIDGTLHRTIEEEIPGSSYIIMGSSTYVFFPSDTPTTITMYGTATGSATIKITERIDDIVTATTTFFHIPIVPTTVGTITLSSLASTSPFTIDNDGNGSADLSLSPLLNGAILVDPFIDSIPLTLTPDNKTIILGSPIPLLTATISGFVDGDTAATSVTGAPSCATTATSGSPVGRYSIICTVGTLSSEKYEFETFATGTLTIIYKWTGFMQPINDTVYNPTQSQSVFKSGSTVPVKFQLKNANGATVQSSSSPLWLAPQKLSAMSASIDESTYSYPATSGTTFRWDEASQQYIYNWSTKGLAAGYWYRIYAKLEDETTQSVVVGIR